MKNKSASFLTIGLGLTLAAMWLLAREETQVLRSALQKWGLTYPESQDNLPARIH